MKPNDGPLENEFRDLSAQLTVQRGKYGQEGDFRKSIKDKDVQDRLHSQQNLIKSIDIRQRAIEEAKRAVTKNPSPANIMALADALVEQETDKGFGKGLFT